MAESVVVTKGFLSSGCETIADLVHLFNPEMPGFVEEAGFVDFDQGPWMKGLKVELADSFAKFIMLCQVH